ncbi:uncharacterized protein LTR77_005660 [Saxophila tyrrhenica]|uniref:Saccharopine dehydrogenase NADP binding domain-containing protein n=1 Tax=Saxophila tyrrhenica TaxID=1690608 RepID=A0AAV9PD68_9PEZI|nr:hypothetical protein LTR77_005660 [Saxophila tyrrhenica]
MADLMIYGATGYTGRLICEQAKKTGLRFTIAGRSEDKLRDLARTLEVPYEAFDLAATSPNGHLASLIVLLNCAGPFSRTASVLMDACIRCKVHYLDVSAELDSYLLARERGELAEKAGIMLVPGCGGSVAMLGGLVAHATRTSMNPASIDIALHVSGPMSRGSAVSAAESVTAGCLKLDGAALVPQDATKNAWFDFGDGRGLVSCFPATLPDLITLHKQTGAGNIHTFVNASADAFPTGDVALLPDGPDSAQRAASPYHAAVRVVDKDGSSRQARLHMVNGYTFTAIAAVEAARRILSGEASAGWQTPVGLFGNDYIHAVPGSYIRHEEGSQGAMNASCREG